VTPQDAIERLVLCAECYLGFTEVPPGSNKGQVVEAFLKTVGLDGGHPWCAAAIAHCGKLAMGAEWPVPITGRVQEVVTWGRLKDCLLDKHATPERGDLMVLFSPSLKRYAHIALVRTVEPGRVECLEGNTNDAGGREGFAFLARWRKRPDPKEYDPSMRFLRWVRAYAPD
jgi:hypothetical protein